MVCSWVSVYLPHGQGAHVSHENNIILLYRPVVYTLYISRFAVVVQSRHTREKKTVRNRIRRRKQKKKIHETNKNANRALIDAAHEGNQCQIVQIDRKSKFACINYKTSTIHYKYIILNPRVCPHNNIL